MKANVTIVYIEIQCSLKEETSTVKPVHVVTFNKQSSVLKGDLFLVMS